MRILHTSDLHGRYKPLLRRLMQHDYDLWVDTGDFQAHPGLAKASATLSHQPIAQRKWWQFKDLARRIVQALDGRPALMVQGNHDFFSRYPALIRQLGGKVHLIEPGQCVSLLGERFSGFREVPHWTGRWQGETEQAAFAPIVDAVWAHQPTVLVTHAPPAGILDDPTDALHTGVEALATALSERKHQIRLHLFGHIHERAGSTTVGGVRYVNGATQMQIVELPPHVG